MCLIVVAHRMHADYPLIVGANRDEFHGRPTAPARFWDDRPDILAGRDLLGRGTWLGVSRMGRFAALTNYRSSSDGPRDAPSRGSLVTDFLDAVASPREYLDSVSERGADFNGFSLLVAEGDDLGWYSNRDGAPRWLEPGLYGLSNALLDTPWPKVTKIKAALGHLMAADFWNADELLAVLADSHPALDRDLPSTGVGAERERQLSALFIQGEHYGTRSSTVLTIDREQTVAFVERTHVPGHQGVSTVHFEFGVRDETRYEVGRG